MYELLLRTETLFLKLGPVWLLGIGVPALVAGLVLWLGGVRYSTWIIGLLGALVGAVVGLMVGQWVSLHLWLSMIVGAAALATASVLLRNVLIIVLAVMVIAAAAGGGYLAVVLDRAAPQPETEVQVTDRQSVPFQSFSDMDQGARLDYVDKLSRQEEDFAERVRAVGNNTWDAAQPHLWKLVLSVVIGGAVAIFLVWFIKKALIALAYSVVGTATIVVGLQTALLGVGVHAVSALPPRLWILPATFGSMIGFGWLFQLIFAPRPGKQKAKETRNDAENA